MRPTEYVDQLTQQQVQAQQVEHGGSLIENMQEFEDGDWIITWPIEFDGLQRKTVIKKDVFTTRFKRVGDTGKIDWKNQFGWG